MPCYSIPKCFVDHRCSSTLKASGFMANLHCLREGRGGLSSVMFQKGEECYFAQRASERHSCYQMAKYLVLICLLFFFFLLSNGKSKMHNLPRLMQTWCQD